MRNFKPLYDKILVKRTDLNSKSSEIIIPDQLKEKPNTGEVISTGCGKLLENGIIIPLQTQIKDIVIFGKYSGANLDDDYLILREDEILGIM